MIDSNQTQPPATLRGDDGPGAYSTSFTPHSPPRRRQQHRHHVTPRAARTHQTKPAASHQAREKKKRKAQTMNNSDNRNRAIEYATELTERAAGLTIMAAIETARNNLTPSQQQNTLDNYGNEDYAAAATPSQRPPSHHTPQARTGRTKTTAKKTQHPNSTSQKSEPTPRA